MISHDLKLIFVHIPKCGGSSIKDFFFDGQGLDWRTPDYERLYGWCPKRRIHLQHATARQLLEMDLVSQTTWNEYFKFTVVRNPWDRSYSDYLWIKRDRGIRFGTFRNYLNAAGPFRKVLADRSTMNYRGDHLVAQSDFFDEDGRLSLDLVGRFECYGEFTRALAERFGGRREFDQHAKKNTSRHSHYSLFYTNSMVRSVNQKYQHDATRFHYRFDDRRKGIWKLKRFF